MASKQSSRSKKTTSSRSPCSITVKQPANGVSRQTEPDDDFPVVGIGASADGLEAFSQLL
jgi:chemotaxis response regulator CheB